MSGIEITMHQEFSQELLKLADLLRAWDKNLEQYLVSALKVIANRWLAEAKKRVPVDMGTLRSRILSEVYKDSSGWVCAVGTNVAYGKFLEFGTKYIAGGLVQKLGDSIDITDEQAIHAWPAKNFGSGAEIVKKGVKTGWRERGGYINERTGEANKPLANAWTKAFSGGSPQEEMPWLRTSYSAVKTWAIEMLAEALRSSGESSKGAA